MAKTTTGTYYTRDATARILAKNLGPYSWHKDLMCTTERTKDYQGYRGAGLLLYPCCTQGSQPFYAMPEIMHFVHEMSARFHELGPKRIKGTRLRIPAIDHRTTNGPHGFRLNEATKA